MAESTNVSFVVDRQNKIDTQRGRGAKNNLVSCWVRELVKNWELQTLFQKSSRECWCPSQGSASIRLPAVVTPLQGDVILQIRGMWTTCSELSHDRIAVWSRTCDLSIASHYVTTPAHGLTNCAYGTMQEISGPEDAL